MMDYCRFLLEDSSKRKAGASPSRLETIRQTEMK